MWWRPVLSVFLAAAGFFLLSAWCIFCMAAPLWLVIHSPIDGMPARAAAVVACVAGLWFALWTVAKLTRSRFP
jgi:hypothetical protein